MEETPNEPIYFLLTTIYLVRLRVLAQGLTVVAAGAGAIYTTIQEKKTEEDHQ